MAIFYSLGVRLSKPNDKNSEKKVYATRKGQAAQKKAEKTALNAKLAASQSSEP